MLFCYLVFSELSENVKSKNFCKAFLLIYDQNITVKRRGEAILKDAKQNSCSSSITFNYLQKDSKFIKKGHFLTMIIHKSCMCHGLNSHCFFPYGILLRYGHFTDSKEVNLSGHLGPKEEG